MRPRSATATRAVSEIEPTLPIEKAGFTSPAATVNRIGSSSEAAPRCSIRFLCLTLFEVFICSRREEKGQESEGASIT